MQKTDEERLAELLTTDKERGFKEIYAQYFSPLFRHACKILKDDNLAADTVQEVFIILWTRPEDWKVEKNISSFLFSCLRNKILDLIKHEKVKANHFDSLIHFNNKQHPATDYLVRENNMAQLIEKEISLLPKKMQHIFKLSRHHHLSYKEIASETNISEGTVRKQIYYALRILRSKLSTSILFILFLF